MHEVYEMKKLLLCLLLISCVKESKREFLEDRFYLTWVSATDIQINKIWKNYGDWFARPYNAEVLLAEITYIDRDKYEKLVDCLYWRVPGRNTSNGQLSFVTVEKGKSCGSSKEKPKVLVRDVLRMKMIYTRGDQVELASYGELKEFKLLLQYQVRDTKGNKSPVRNLISPLVNFIPQIYKNPQVEAERFSSSLTKTVYPGLRINAIGRFKEKEVQVSSKAKWIGNIKDHFQNRSLEFCQVFSAECLETTSYKCDRCRYGQYQVAGQCPTKNDRACGVDKCGQRGELACPRGNQHNEESKDRGCVKDSTSGICQKGLVATCLEKKYLVCL